MLLFDNYGNLSGNGYSRVIEFDPLTSRIVWSYEGKPGDMFQSGKRSGQQRLPNGNTLITESDAGRIIEVTASGEIVWEFINPVRSGEGDSLIPVISTGERFAAESLKDSFRERLADSHAKQGDSL
jgi:outer membrane protein assembly factor BamB